MTTQEAAAAVLMAGMNHNPTTVTVALVTVMDLCLTQQDEIDALKSHTHPKPIELMRF